MKFYHYQADANHYGYLRFTQKYTYELGFPISGQFDEGHSIAASWQPVTMEVDISGGPLGDFPRCPMGPPVLSKQAWNVLCPHIGTVAEALPVMTPFGDYFALNILDVIDCLDHMRSEFTYYPASLGGGRHRIIKYQLKPALIIDKLLFKIPEQLTRVIVSEKFKELVAEASLKGLDFSTILADTNKD